MGKTYRKIQGEKFFNLKDKKKPKDTKFFGYTSGMHSQNIETKIENGEVIQTKIDTATIKGVDYVKYGYPFDRRNHNVIKNKIQEDLNLILL